MNRSNKDDMWSAHAEISKEGDEELFHTKLGLIGDSVTGKTREGVEMDLFGIDIDAQTKMNTDYRRVVFTSDKSQLVVMSVETDEDIPFEVHALSDQFFKVEEGTGLFEISSPTGKRALGVSAGGSITVSAGTNHRVSNRGSGPLKLYIIYSPPVHPYNTRHARQNEVDEQAEEEEEDSQFAKRIADMESQIVELEIKTDALNELIAKARAAPAKATVAELHNDYALPVLRATAELVAVLEKEKSIVELVAGSNLGTLKYEEFVPIGVRKDSSGRTISVLLRTRLGAVQIATERTSAIARQILSYNNVPYSERVREMWRERNDKIRARGVALQAELYTERSGLLLDLADARRRYVDVVLEKEKFLFVYKQMLKRVGKERVPEYVKLDRDEAAAKEEIERLTRLIRTVKAEISQVRVAVARKVNENTRRCERDVLAYENAETALQSANDTLLDMEEALGAQIEEDMFSANSDVDSEIDAEQNSADSQS